MRRFFIDKIEEIVSLVGEEFRHAVNVLRIKKGDEVVLCDNTAYEYTAVAEEIGKNSVMPSMMPSRTIRRNSVMGAG